MASKSHVKTKCNVLRQVETVIRLANLIVFLLILFVTLDLVKPL